MREHWIRTRSLRPALALFTLTGCPAEPEPGRWEPTLEEEARVVGDLYRARGLHDAMRLDLADERQYRFLRDRLLAAGVTPSSRPEIHRGLERARERARSAAPVGVGGADTDTGGELSSSESCNAFIVPETLGATVFDSLSRASCFEGSAYSFVSQTQYDARGAIMATTSTEDWDDGVATDLALSSTISKGAVVSADMVGLFYFDHDEDGVLDDDPQALLVRLDDVVRARDLTMAHPRDFGVGDAPILICLERTTSDYRDCEYYHRASGGCSSDAICDANGRTHPVLNPPYDDGQLYIPLQSSGSRTLISYSTPTISAATGYLTLLSDGRAADGTSVPAGGLCVADFSEAVRIDDRGDADDSTWGVEIKDSAPPFGTGTWAEHCVANRKLTELHLDLLFETTNALGRVRQQHLQWSSTQEGQLPPISIYWGCMPPGTLIRMADGGELPVEEVREGSLVLADETGRTLTVSRVVTGSEHQPLVVVQDDLGHLLRLTGGHAVATVDRGVVAARELREGDRLWTEEGISLVTQLHDEPYEGPVFNLELGVDEELNHAPLDSTTMLAEGVRVGDARLQGALVGSQHALALQGGGR